MVCDTCSKKEVCKYKEDVEIACKEIEDILKKHHGILTIKEKCIFDDVTNYRFNIQQFP